MKFIVASTFRDLKSANALKMQGSAEKPVSLILAKYFDSARLQQAIFSYGNIYNLVQLETLGWTFIEASIASLHIPV